eukprot:snap_masked-scaffold_20-processed-gene-4.30-mRNA-1 protein AED:1.00 eAED:1.00 QI:0/0/0/0/1/1/2/0/177
MFQHQAKILLIYTTTDTQLIKPLLQNLNGYYNNDLITSEALLHNSPVETTLLMLDRYEISHCIFCISPNFVDILLDGGSPLNSLCTLLLGAGYQTNVGFTALLVHEGEDKALRDTTAWPPILLGRLGNALYIDLTILDRVDQLPSDDENWLKLIQRCDSFRNRKVAYSLKKSVLNNI